MKLLIQPEDGVKPVIDAFASAQKTLEIAIFRCDHPEIEKALVDCVKRGVAVQALIAFTNRGGEKRLRELEMRLLGAGAVVARSSQDLSRYHSKYAIIDRKKLLVLAFNFTRADLRLTRSFGFITTKPKIVQEAVKLFAADCTRQEYTSNSNGLIVSPVNARKRLGEFLSGAKKQLLIYDLEISDPAMLQVLHGRAEAGVEIRVIGGVKGNPGSEVRMSNPLRLHARTIVRDRSDVFIGSQSLRRPELDLRREVGLLVHDTAVAARIAKIFELDWESAKSLQMPAEKVSKKVAKAVAKELGPIMPVLEELAARNDLKLPADRDGIEQVVKDAVKVAVREAVHDQVAQMSAEK